MVTPIEDRYFLSFELSTTTHKDAQALTAVRRKARALMMFAGTLRYRLSPDVHSYLTRLDVAIAL